MNKGGKRQGAGRKRGSKSKSTLEIKAIIDSCVDFNEVIEKLAELVNGITVKEKRGKEFVVYDKPPDANAAKILLEYRFGKPQQSISLDTPPGVKITFTRTIVPTPKRT